MSKRFLLDANAFIEPRDRYYGFDICPGYWTTLLNEHTNNRVFSIDRIRRELVPSKKEDWDDLAEWIDEKAPTTFFKQTEDQAVFDVFQEMVTWAYDSSQFKDAAKTEFASVADGWLVAYAKVNKMVVITHEDYSPEIKKSIKIPNVCVEFDVEYINVFEMLRELGAKFLRSTKRRRRRR